MTHQVDQLKEEISAKESALVKLHLEQQRIEKEKETLKVQILPWKWWTNSLSSQGRLYAHLRPQGAGRTAKVPGGWVLPPLGQATLQVNKDEASGNAQTPGSAVLAIIITSAEENLAGQQCPRSPGACRLPTIPLHWQPRPSPPTLLPGPSIRQCWQDPLSLRS